MIVRTISGALAAVMIFVPNFAVPDPNSPWWLTLPVDPRPFVAISIVGLAIAGAILFSWSFSREP